MRFGKNIVWGPKYIDIYEFRGCTEEGGCTWSTVHFLFKKTDKVQEHDLYLNQILHHFNYIFFSRMSNKKLRKEDPRGPPSISLRSEYSSSN